MKVVFTSETKEDFRKHNDYVRKQMKSDGHKYLVNEICHSTLTNYIIRFCRISPPFHRYRKQYPADWGGHFIVNG